MRKAGISPKNKYFRFCELLRENGIHKTTPKITLFLKILYTVILAQLKVKGRAEIPFFGTFTIKFVKRRRISKQECYEFDKPKMEIQFRPTKFLMDAVLKNDYNLVIKNFEYYLPKTKQQEYDKMVDCDIDNVVIDLFDVAKKKQKENQKREEERLEFLKQRELARKRKLEERRKRREELERKLKEKEKEKENNDG